MPDHWPNLIAGALLLVVAVNAFCLAVHIRRGKKIKGNEKEDV